MLVEAISNAMAAVKFAPLRKRERASATAAYEHDEDAAPRPVATVRVRAGGEVVVIAVECAVDEVERCLGGGDAVLEACPVGFQRQPPGGRAVCGDHGMDVAEAESGFLGSQDDRDPAKVARAVAAAAVDVATGGEQMQGLPVAQDVRGQPEAVGRLSDAHGIA